LYPVSYDVVADYVRARAVSSLHVTTTTIGLW